MGKRFIYLLVLAVFINACSNTKYLTGNQKLYTGADVKVDTAHTTKSQRGEIADEMKALVRPQPNSSILGLRYKLWIYNKTHARRNFIQKIFSGMGEPPVLAGSVDLVANSNIMQNRLQNEGYFQAQASGDTVSKGKTAKAVFNVQPGPGYTIRNINFPKGRTDLDTAVAGTKKDTYLKSGDKYNLDVIKGERIRIDAKLKEEGFYYFAPENLIVRVDTPVVNHQVDLTVEVKPEVADRARRIYKINNIYIYPNYTLRDTSLMLDQAKPYRNYFVVQKREYVRDFVFKQTVQFDKGSTYNRTEHNKALNRFVELGPFKFVKNRFEDVSTDSPKLNVFYFLTPYQRKSLQAEILTRSTSANFTGTQVNLSWRNRNAFKGAELLTVSLFGSTDVQVAGQNSGDNVFQYGINTSLSWPRFISPIDFTNTSAFVPHTTLTFQYAITNRVNYYNLNAFSTSFGYQWKQNVHKSHELNILNLTYVNAANVSAKYDSLIAVTPNPTLKHVVDNQLTFGPSYSYTFTNTTDNYRTNTWYFNGKVSESALLAGLLTGADTLAGKPRAIKGTNFNQYIKLESEFRYYHKTSKLSSVAGRFYAGAGLPFGNSTIMPYSQQFFIGGTNSLRGFRARSIGPGTFQPQQNSGGVTAGFLPDESGDIKLEANLEYRPHLFSIVNGALFVDAGNVWNLNSQKGLPGSAFGKNFLNQLAGDVGFGLRFDVTVLILRTDFAFPVLTPYSVNGQRFKFDSKNGVFNLAIGYPF